MQQEIQLNIITFTAPVDEAEFSFYTAKQDGYCPIHIDDLNGAIEGLGRSCFQSVFKINNFSKSNYDKIRYTILSNHTN